MGGRPRGKKGSGRTRKRTKSLKQRWRDLPKHEKPFTVLPVITADQIAGLMNKKVRVLSLAMPTRSKTPGCPVRWHIASDSQPGPHVSTSIAIVTTVQCADSVSKKVFYVGNFEGNSPPPDANVLLMLYIKPQEGTNSGSDFINPQEMLEKAHRCQYEIFTDHSRTDHHGSTGKTFGIGARLSTTNHQTGSSVGQYSTKSTKAAPNLAKELKQTTVSQMEHAREAVHNFLGFDLHGPNSAMAQVAADTFRTNGAANDFHLLGKTGYCSLYVCIDAATRDPHTEEDWAMTTLFVPRQNWDRKEPLHLSFRFLLNNITSLKLSCRTDSCSGSQLFDEILSPWKMNFFHHMMQTSW